MERKKLKNKILALCEIAYWYGEETGDYEMTMFHYHPSFKEIEEEINGRRKKKVKYCHHNWTILSVALRRCLKCNKLDRRT